MPGAGLQPARRLPSRNFKSSASAVSPLVASKTQKLPESPEFSDRPPFEWGGILKFERSVIYTRDRYPSLTLMFIGMIRLLMNIARFRSSSSTPALRSSGRIECPKLFRVRIFDGDLGTTVFGDSVIRCDRPFMTEIKRCSKTLQIVLARRCVPVTYLRTAFREFLAFGECEIPRFPLVREGMDNSIPPASTM